MNPAKKDGPMENMGRARMEDASYLEVDGETMKDEDPLNFFTKSSTDEEGDEVMMEHLQGSILLVDRTNEHTPTKINNGAPPSATPVYDLFSNSKGLQLVPITLTKGVLNPTKHSTVTFHENGSPKVSHGRSLISTDARNK